MTITRQRLAIAAAAFALLLTGCSAGGGTAGGGTAGGGTTTGSTDAPAAGGDQTKAEACAIVKDSFTEFGELSSSISSSDPQAAVDTFKEFSAKTGDTLDSITNTEVKPAATKAAQALSDYVVFLEAVIADPSKANGMTDELTALQEGFTDAATVCAG